MVHGVRCMIPSSKFGMQVRWAGVLGNLVGTTLDKKSLKPRGSRVRRLGFRIQNLGFRMVWRLQFQGSGFRVSWLRVYGFGLGWVRFME